MSKDVCVVEQRWEEDGMIRRNLRHLASSQPDAEAWINEHPELHQSGYWFALWKHPVDEPAHNVPPHQFYTSDGEKIDKQPINQDAEDRRAEQAGFTSNNPADDSDTV